MELDEAQRNIAERHRIRVIGEPIAALDVEGNRIAASAWDTRRIVDSRWEHLDWMHSHFADEVLLAGEGSETMPEEEGH